MQKVFFNIVDKGTAIMYTPFLTAVPFFFKAYLNLINTHFLKNNPLLVPLRHPWPEHFKRLFSLPKNGFLYLMESLLRKKKFGTLQETLTFVLWKPGYLNYIVTK